MQSDGEVIGHEKEGFDTQVEYGLTTHFIDEKVVDDLNIVHGEITEIDKEQLVRFPS
jgi:hypothetical protein